MRHLLFLLSLTLLLQAQDALIKSRQLIVVTTKGWNDNNGTMQRFEKDAAGWHRVGEIWHIKLGRNGLGWGIGLHHIPKGARYIKHEGDGRAPAGIFALKQAFGYRPFAVRYPYRVYKESDHCVDDVHSRYYNKIVDATKITPDYHSMEHMKFAKNYYEYGITVNHNHFDEAGAIPGRGSCIFIHIKTVPTAGCTVVDDAAKMRTLIAWLDAKKHPLLIQAPQDTIETLLHQVGLTTRAHK